MVWAHPRSRGEHPPHTSPVPVADGSSPLARGTLYGIVTKEQAAGLIPARAGNTETNSTGYLRRQAHPRSRGEHYKDTYPRKMEPGSSPLARGTRELPFAKIPRPGLIPARAGNTMPRRTFLPALRAHPRSRGEHSTAALCASTASGSSPLARGTRELPFAKIPRPGLIPARAGNTRQRIPCTSPVRAHPRSRGEHPGEDGSTEIHPGSSPLARGTPGHPLANHGKSGLIPARAGNTRRPLEVILNVGAHPRSRGEHSGIGGGCRR